MNQYSSIIKKYYLTFIGVSLIGASLFHFARPVFSAGTEAGQKIRNTATGSYKDDVGNPYTIDSNTVEVTVARVAGITNIPSGITDETTTNTSVLTDDKVSFEFTITNVGNHRSDIHIPDIRQVALATKGLKKDATLKLEIKGIDSKANANFSSSPTATFIPISDYVASNPTAVPVTVKNVPANGQIIVKVIGEVSATAAGAPIEVRLGDTGSNTDPNNPVADTQNQFDTGTNPDAAIALNEVRTVDPTTVTVNTLLATEQKEASALQRVFLGANPVAMARIGKTRGTVTGATLTTKVIPYELKLEVLDITPNSLFTPGKLDGRDFGGRVSGTFVSGGTINDSKLILVSDAIPAKTEIQGAVTNSPTDWTPVYAVYTSGEPAYDATKNLAADQLTWITQFPTANPETVKRVGWVYDARTTGGKSPINPGTTISGFKFNVVTTGVTPTDGTVANIAQVFGSTVNGPKVFDESGDQDASNFTGTNPGASETASGSTGIANPSGHGVDSENNNNATNKDPVSPGGEDNVITIGAPGDLINGPNGQPAATGNVFGQGPDNNHDFQNKGISNFKTGVACTSANTTNAQDGKACKLNPAPVVFKNTLSNPATPVPNSTANDLKNVLLQPINPGFNSFGGTDSKLDSGTKVTIKLGTQQAIYTYTNNKFVLDTNDPNDPTKLSKAIEIPTLPAGVSLDYEVTIDLPDNTELSTKTGRGGYAVPIIAFIDGDDDGTPDSGENSNYTVNQVYTDFVKVTKEVQVLDPNGSPRANMGFGALDSAKKPLPGDILEFKVNYRNISEPQAGNGNNLVLNGIDVTIDENGTQAGITGVTNGNNWGLDSTTDSDDDLDTINVQNTATDSNGGTITYYTGASPANSNDKYSVGTLIPAGTTDPGVTVTGYQSKVNLLAPSDTASTFTFQRKVDKYDGLAEEGLK